MRKRKSDLTDVIVNESDFEEICDRCHLIKSETFNLIVFHTIEEITLCANCYCEVLWTTGAQLEQENRYLKTQINKYRTQAQTESLKESIRQQTLSLQRAIRRKLKETQ